jgi:hypothetical protein
MKINHLLFAFALITFLTSCVGVQNASYYRSPGFDPSATFKVITLNTNDLIAGRLEHYLLTNDFRVISDNSFRIPGSAAFPNPSFPMDSAQLNSMVVNIPYMEEKPSDYIIRYQFDNPPRSAPDNARSSLNITVVNTDTGETEISYLSQQKGRLEPQQIDRVIQGFVSRLKRR